MSLSVPSTALVRYEPALSEVEQQTLVGYLAGYRGYTGDAVRFCWPVRLRSELASFAALPLGVKASRSMPTGRGALAGRSVAVDASRCWYTLHGCDWSPGASSIVEREGGDLLDVEVVAVGAGGVAVLVAMLVMRSQGGQCGGTDRRPVGQRLLDCLATADDARPVGVA
jgi:hypothetical protein